MSRCPICNGEVAARQQNAAFPFCSARCKTVDLGKWLNEEYRVPGGEEDAGEEEAPPPERDMRH